ncbi:hypothetical protein FZ078_01090 [Listeria monocytogenes]|uniref:hypothetical protein n=1 Tax=Listeria monocytogenes TaxID=1639 RepID=UPI0011F32BE1|nr:hypothetical protein [Listeria monocytogenes]EKZ1003242.1 hypothetical protein [Listeria monocytogenes]EKZ1008907.1 hypothetical protein [Listeria monocytogenes]ELP8596247.1 hypothetical protein [Listeria monocytogenes]TYV86150.1 hypothetical protein FZ078_01090 [Listeria monocytogenes]
MKYQMLKDANVEEIKGYYKSIQGKFNVEAEIPNCIFYNPTKVYVFDLWGLLDGNIQYVFNSTKKTGEHEVLWIPKYNNIYANEYMYINLNVAQIDFRELWDQNKLTIFLEQGCMFDLNGNWIIYFDLEENIAILGVFSASISLNNFPISPHTEETFLDEYLMIPIEEIDKKNKILMKQYNQNFVKVFLENYLKHD